MLRKFRTKWRESRRWRWGSVIALVLIIIAIFYFWPRNEASGEFAPAGRQTVSQEVYVIGTVRAAEAIDLAFEQAGVVRSVRKQAGEPVRRGELIASLDNGELAVRLGQRQAAAERERLILRDLIDPPTAIDRLKAENAATSADNAIAQANEDAFSVLAATYVDLTSILDNVDSTLSHNGLTDADARLSGQTTVDARKDAETAYFAANNLYKESYKRYRELSREDGEAALIAMLGETQTVAQRTAEAVKLLRVVALRIIDDLGAQASAQLLADRDTLNADLATANTRAAEIVKAKDVITAANRTAEEAQESLRDLLDGPKEVDRRNQELRVREAELAAQEIGQQIRQRTITSPIDGTISRVEVQVGESVAVGTPAVSVISGGRYEVEARVPEVEISKVNLGATTTVTLDAFPGDTQFTAVVTEIEPGETLVEGLATYKVTLVLTEADPRVRSGMTANLVIVGDKRENVLAIPEGSVISRNGRSYVMVLENEDSEPIERPVTVGLRGSNGLVEITSGLTEGELVKI